MSQQPDNPWRIEKRISVSDLMKTLLIAAAFFIYLTQMEKDIASNQSQVAYLREQVQVEKEARDIAVDHLRDRVDRSEDRIESTLESMKKSLQRIEDRLYDRAEQSE